MERREKHKGHDVGVFGTGLLMQSCLDTPQSNCKKKYGNTNTVELQMK